MGTKECKKVRFQLLLPFPVVFILPVPIFDLIANSAIIPARTTDENLREI
jgi:hypothetical protein